MMNYVKSMKEEKVNGEKTGNLLPVNAQFYGLSFILDDNFGEKVYREISRVELVRNGFSENAKVFDKKKLALLETRLGSEADELLAWYNGETEVDPNLSISYEGIDECLHKYFVAYISVFAGGFYDGSTTEDGRLKLRKVGLKGSDKLRRLCITYNRLYADSSDTNWSQEQIANFNEIKDALKELGSSFLNGEKVEGVRKGYAYNPSSKEVKIFINKMTHKQVILKDARSSYKAPCDKPESFDKAVLEYLLGETWKTKKNVTKDDRVMI